MRSLRLHKLCRLEQHLRRLDCTWAGHHAERSAADLHAARPYYRAFRLERFPDELIGFEDRHDALHVRQRLELLDQSLFIALRRADDADDGTLHALRKMHAIAARLQVFQQSLKLCFRRARLQNDNHVLLAFLSSLRRNHILLCVRLPPYSTRCLPSSAMCATVKSVCVRQGHLMFLRIPLTPTPLSHALRSARATDVAALAPGSGGSEIVLDPSARNALRKRTK